MATTRLMPLHTGKGRTVGTAISDIIDYVQNPQKTDNGRLITSYQCDSRIADAEFLFNKRQHIAATGRVRGEDDVIAYHLRQSFVPGEITPEEANRLGCELARRFTKGKHAFIVCTHIDKKHIHNHIIFDATALDYDYLTEYENLDELNHLACLLSELDQSDLEKFEAVIDSGEHTSSVADLINLTQNLDCFEFYPGVGDDETLGRIYVEDMEAIDVPEHLLNYFDYEAYGRDIRINEDGHYAPGGYVLNNGGKFIEHYHGIEDIPAEHRVFSYPKLSIREQMAAYKEIIDGSSLEGYRKLSNKEREER